MASRIKSYRLYFCFDYQSDYPIWSPIGVIFKSNEDWMYESQDRRYRPFLTMFSGGGPFALIGFLIEKEFKYLIDVNSDQSGNKVYRYIEIEKFLRTAFVGKERGIRGLYSAYENWETGKPKSYKSVKNRRLWRIQIHNHYAEALLPYLRERGYTIKGLTPARKWMIGQPI